MLYMERNLEFENLEKALNAYKHDIEHFSTDYINYDFEEIELILFVRQSVHDHGGDDLEIVKELDSILKSFENHIKELALHEVEPDYPQENIEQNLIDEEDRNFWWWQLANVDDCDNLFE